MNSETIEKDNKKKEEISEFKDQGNDSDFLILNKFSKESINNRDFEENESLKHQDLNPFKKICVKIGGCLQNCLLNLSEKINVPPLYALFPIFFMSGFFLIFTPMIDFPSQIFKNTNSVLLLLSLGNLSFTISFCFCHGPKEFLKIVADKKNADVIIGHLISVILGLFFRNKYYLFDIFLGVFLFFITPSFLIVFLPGKKQCNQIIDKICETIRICKKNKVPETYDKVNTFEDDEDTKQMIR